MKKMISLVLVVLMLATCALCFASCQKSNDDFVATDATDLIKEDFGIGVKKGNAALLAAVNAVVDKWVADGTMAKYEEYYTKLADFSEDTTGSLTKPEAGDLKVTWDFGSATEAITVYTESGFAPFEFVYDGAVVGLDIAIMNEVAVNLGKKVVVTDAVFDTLPTHLETAQGDAVIAAGLTINAERAEKMDFSNVYYSSTLVIVADKDAPISSVKDLAGKKVGVQQGTSGDLIITKAATDAGYEYVTENDAGEEITVTVKAAGAEVKQYEKYAMALADLKAGRIDAILMDKLPAQTMLGSAN